MESVVFAWIKLRQVEVEYFLSRIILVFETQSHESSQVFTVVTQVLLLDIIRYKESFPGHSFHKTL